MYSSLYRLLLHLMILRKSDEQAAMSFIEKFYLILCSLLRLIPHLKKGEKKCCTLIDHPDFDGFSLNSL